MIAMIPYQSSQLLLPFKIQNSKFNIIQMSCFFIKSIYTRFLPAISIIIIIYLRPYVSFISFYPIFWAFCHNYMKYHYLEDLTVLIVPLYLPCWFPVGYKCIIFYLYIKEYHYYFHILL